MFRHHIDDAIDRTGNAPGLDHTMAAGHGAERPLSTTSGFLVSVRRGLQAAAATLALGVLAWASPAAAQTGGQQLLEPWPQYFGGHVGPETWGRVVRGFGRSANQTISFRPTADIEAIMLDLADRLVELIAQDQDVVMPVGGLSSGREQDVVSAFMNSIEADDGQSYKDLVRLKATIIGLVPGAEEAVYWQAGNEINSRHYSNSLRAWSRMRQIDEPNDPFIIPLYVEYFLAPTVEALEEASVEIHGRPGMINIMLGSLVRTNGEGANWGADLLSYQIEGRFAPSLAGKMVHELVDILAVHYVVSKETDVWLETLDGLAAAWLGIGRIRGLWSTEETGKSRGDTGKGAANAIRVAFRYMDWWSMMGLNSDEGRAIFWGSEFETVPGTAVTDSMQTLLDFMGDQSLVRVAPESIGGVDEGLEYYAFDSENGRDRVLAVFSSSTRNTDILNAITMPMDGISFNAVAVANVFSTRGHRVVDVAVERSGSTLTLTPSTPIGINSTDVSILLTIGR